jgi:hypothetical protein
MDLGMFGDSTFPSDTARLDFTSKDTNAAIADVDTYFVRRYFNGILLDSNLFVALQNKVRLGYYSVPFRAKYGSNYGKYHVELEVHKQGKQAKASAWYEVYRRFKGRDFYQQLYSVNLLTEDSIVIASQAAQDTSKLILDSLRILLDRFGSLEDLADAHLDDSLSGIKQKIYAYLNATISSRSTFNPITDIVYYVGYVDTVGKGSGSGATPAELWGYETRGLTEIVVASDTNVSGDTLARQKDSTSFQGSGGATANQIWTYETRGLTQSVIAAETLATGKKIARQDSLESLIAAEKLWYADLNDDSSGGGGASAAEIWGYAGEKEIDTAGYLKAGAGAGATAAEVADTLAGRGWMIGNGANLCSLWVLTTEDTSAAVGVPISIKNNSFNATIAQNLTNANGVALFRLADGTFKVLTNLPDYPQVNDYDTFTVSGASQDTIWVSTFDPGDPPEPYLCRAWNCIFKNNGLPDSGATVEMKIKHVPLKYGNLMVSPYGAKDTCDADGFFHLDVFPNSVLTPDSTVYQVLIRHTDGKIFSDTLTVPDSSSWRMIWQ